jgi:TPR repeat protein
MQLSICYEKGRGVTQDNEQTIYWHQEAAAGGEVVAQFLLGLCYDGGSNLFQEDYQQAVVWYQKAAEQGYVEAQYYLGICYEKGQGVEKNDEQAIFWYQKAIEQGNEEAKQQLESLLNKNISLKSVLNRTFLGNNPVPANDNNNVGQTNFSPYFDPLYKI